MPFSHFISMTFMLLSLQIQDGNSCFTMSVVNPVYIWGVGVDNILTNPCRGWQQCLQFRGSLVVLNDLHNKVLNCCLSFQRTFIKFYSMSTPSFTQNGWSPSMQTHCEYMKATCRILSSLFTQTHPTSFTPLPWITNHLILSLLP